MDISILLAFPLLLALSTSCDACYCKLLHPQSVYCNSDIVILADIWGKGEVFEHSQALKVNVSKIYKGPLKANEIHEIYTPRSFYDCGYFILNADQNDLLIAGFLKSGKIHFTRCHLVYMLSRLSLEQRLGFKKYYKKGCQCKVEPCLSCKEECAEADVKDCTWKQKNCQYGHWEGKESMTSICFPSKGGRCHWTTIPTDGRDLTPW